MKNTRKNAIITSIAVIFACIGSASAVPTLRISDGINPDVVITDNGPGDSQGATAGAILWVGSIGSWNLNVDTGLTKPFYTDPPHMDLNYSASSVGAGMLTLTFSDDGYNYSGGIIDRFGGTTAGMLTDRVLVNNVVVTSQGPFGPGAFSATTPGMVTLVPTDVLSLEVKIVHTGTGPSTSSGDKELLRFPRVPDGGTTVMLLGVALSCLGLMRRKLVA